MPRAVAVGLPEAALQNSASPGIPITFQSCGRADLAGDLLLPDLWIEALHALGLDPVPAFARALSADHDGLQWTFLKQQPEPGWIPLDNLFHLLAATPYSVRLRRYCDQAAPLGKVASVDSLSGATITASA